ncbi:MAG: ribonuclease P protein component [Spirochaetes bacterium]|nr:ribonuclease P protein component [Spirochaetota bacterium]
MKRAYSLKGREVFQEVFRRGKRFSGTDLRIIVRQRKNETDRSGRGTVGNDSAVPRINIGITLSRKYGNAVARNRSRRIIRSICRDYIPLMRGGYYIVIQPGSGFKEKSYIEARGELAELFRKAGVLS